MQVSSNLKPPLIALQPAEHVEPDPTVSGRVVFDRDLVTDAGMLDAIRARPGTHYEVRVHTLVPVKMLAIDRSMALLPVRQHDEALVGVLITESAVLDSFLVLFDWLLRTTPGAQLFTGNPSPPPKPGTTNSPLTAGKKIPQMGQWIKGLAVQHYASPATTWTWKPLIDSR